MAVYFYKGERYSKKSETIFEWMEKDRRKDERLDSAKAPEHIRCPQCNQVMDFESKDLYWGAEEPSRVLLLYRCQNCKKGKAIFDNGEEYEPRPMLCPKCNSEVKTTYKRQQDQIDTVYTCTNPKCSYRELDILDLSKKEEPVVDPNYEADKKRFLMTEKEGSEYVHMEMQLKQFNEHLKEQEERSKQQDLYDKVAQMKKLTLVEVEKLLVEALEKENYIKLNLATPKIDKDIIVDFTAQDAKTGRKEYESSNRLKKLIQKTLVDTNWRLMSYGISYRLGILSGSLRGYEREEDLVRLLNKPKSK